MTDGLDALFADLGPTLGVTEVAELMGMTKQGVYHWLRDGVIPGYKVGPSWFIVRDELKATLRAGANAHGRPKPAEGSGEDDQGEEDD